MNPGGANGACAGSRGEATAPPAPEPSAGSKHRLRYLGRSLWLEGAAGGAPTQSVSRVVPVKLIAEAEEMATRGLAVSVRRLAFELLLYTRTVRLGEALDATARPI